MEGDTASLRKAAPNWTLAGDNQLLGMLQHIHQSIMTKCQEANLKLDAMVDALDTASIDLQNVNNKFMALSNSQFIESRVYDDDVDIKGDEATQKQETPQVVPESELQVVKRCLQQLEVLHEPLLIVDSESSDEEESSMFLRPKDIYSHRPLPYIIGSNGWHNRWHAGLLPEDSDCDDVASEHEPEQYSDSEAEEAVEVTDKHTQRTISSSSMESDVLSRASQPVASPAEVAAELARRLAGPPKPPAEPQTMLPPEPIKKVYGVDKPLPAAIFPSEPPPLDTYDSDKYSDDDIFAELHKKPHQNSHKDSQKPFTNNIVDELFGDSNDIGNVVSDYDQSNNIRNDSPLFDEASTSKRQTNEQTPAVDTNVKKPVGGISLFGSNKGAESIGAAILKRNQRKSLSDDDASDEQTTPVKQPEKDNKEKKIIEDLFTKPTVKKKDTSKKINEKIDSVKPVNKVESKSKDSKVDLFSDIFDDIDDIFTTNVTKPKNDNTKSIFDDDDLFADVVETETPKDRKDRVEIDKSKEKNDEKSIFDSDDDLFSDNVKDLASSVDKTTAKPSAGKADIKPSLITSKVSKEAENKKVKSIFDDDSDNDLFSDIKVSKTESIKEKDAKIDVTNTKQSHNLFSNTIPNINVTNKLNSASKQLQSPNLFDDDDDDNDLFSVNTEQNVKSILKTPQSNENKISQEPIEKDVIRNIDTNTENIKDDSNASDYKVSDSVENIEKTIQLTPSFSKDDSLVVNATRKSVKEDDIISEENIEELEKADTTSIDKNEDESTKKKNKTQIETTSEENKEQLETKKIDDEIINKNVKEDEIVSEKNKKELNEKEIHASYDKEDKMEPNINVIEDDATEKESLLTEQLVPESKEPDIFSDIFNDIPPAFEKPNETKKSKNVNALFDDDSDDEALFFKKNDVISDEKPELDYSSERFRIFHDEPPDIDVDFAQKPLKTTNITHVSDEDDLFSEIQPTINKVNEEIENKNSSILKNEPVDITKLLEETSVKEEVNITQLLEDERDDTLSDTDDQRTESKVEDSKSEEESFKKSIGKLKPMDFNINVNTLLPGASPKKSKANEETDGQIISSNNDVIVNRPSAESKMVKSVSFEGDPESEVLDNKLSKGRAKIQVKRRPSTRRARLEAVRKSGIDFGSDSTDNSSSFDEPKPKTEDRKDLSIERPSIDNKNINTENVLDNTNVNKITSVSKAESTKKPEVKSKIVYILNDEDIFTNTSKTEPKNDKPSIEKESYLKKETSKDKDRKVEIKDKKSLFDDDMSDEELFGKKPVQKTKESLFDSDSGEELFSKKEKKVEQQQEKKFEKSKEKTRVSLFDDESDDDLFSSKTTKVTESKPTVRQNQQTKASEPVFEDPLSMLGDDES